MNLEEIFSLNPGTIVLGGFTFNPNAHLVGGNLDLLDSNGNTIGGYYISDGDELLVLDISYNSQMVLVQYPSGTRVRQGYIYNDTNLIKYNDPYNWQNGSTSETVYLDSTGNDVFGSLDPYESATILYKKNGRTCVVYDTKEKGELSKCGFVDFEGLKSVPSNLTIPYVNYNNVTVRQYGTSGMGKPLNIYKIGNGSKALFAGFAIHGFEDNWPHDGYALVQIATELIKKFADYNSQYGLGDWSIYIAQCINPDGVINGITNNGPGRCTMTTRIDMNRCFPYNFTQLTNPRNYTGPTPLGAPEAVALKNLVEEINNNSSEMIVIDFHGWMNMSQGNAEIGQYFDNQFGFGHNNIYSAGFFSSWATTLKNTKAVLIEYPTNTSNYEDVLRGNYIGKTYNAILNIIKVRNESGGKIPLSVVLSIGAKGEAVKDLQAKLAYIGYQIIIDGIFGEETLKIVEEFQRANNLYVDGIVGAQTMNKLNEKVEREERIKNSNKDTNSENTKEKIEKFNEDTKKNL